MPKSKLDFSIIIPTYTGQEHIEKCFQSILNQEFDSPKPSYEVVVVIDGPNDELRKIVDESKGKFVEKGIKYSIFQFEQNQGRFEARLKGAQLSSAKQLLFIDDRVTFSKNYIKLIIGSNESIVIPNVVEAESKNSISRCLYLLRRRIYGKDKFGTGFKSYYIKSDNFEKSPKGTTSLWIPKKVFIEACQETASEISNKYVNEDTKLFRYVIDEGIKIYKSGEASIEYNPRSSAVGEIKHLYHRGPRFIDYYMKPGTRFFMPLLIAITLFCTYIVAAILYPVIIMPSIIAAFFIDIVVTIAITEDPGDTRMLYVAPIVFAAFGMGLAKGIFNKAHSTITKR